MSKSSKYGDLDYSTVLRLTIQAKELINQRWLGICNPFFRVAGLFGSFSWQTEYESEYKLEELNPIWNCAQVNLDMLCRCDLNRPIRIQVLDYDETGNDDHINMGYIELTINALMKAYEIGGSNHPFTLKDDDGNEYGKLFIVDVSIGEPLPDNPISASKQQPVSSGPLSSSSTSPSTPTTGLREEEGDQGQITKEPKSDETEEEIDITKIIPMDLNKDSTLKLELHGLELPFMKWYGMTAASPFFTISTSMSSQQDKSLQRWQAISRSEHIDEESNPRWKSIEVNVEKLCSRDIFKKIRISVFDYEPTGEHTPMGFVETTLIDLVRAIINKNGSTTGTTTDTISSTDLITNPNFMKKAFTLKADDGQEFGKLLVLSASFGSSKPEKTSTGTTTDSVSGKGVKEHPLDSDNVPQQTNVIEHPAAVTVPKGSMIFLELCAVDLLNQKWFGTSRYSRR